jgi:hypothetical protein
VLPDDLKDYTADSFSLLTPDEAIAWIGIIGLMVAIFRDFLR